MFSLQLFGENDTLKVDDSLIMEYENTQNKDYPTFRFSVPNPKENLTETTIKEAMSQALRDATFKEPKTNVVITGAGNWTSATAYRKTVSTMDLDLS